jgi:hypothetical protein
MMVNQGETRNIYPFNLSSLPPGTCPINFHIVYCAIIGDSFNASIENEISGVKGSRISGSVLSAKTAGKRNLQ